MFWFFGREACWILAPQPVIKPAAPALERKVLTTGLPGKSKGKYLFNIFLKEKLNIHGNILDIYYAYHSDYE